MRYIHIAGTNGKGSVAEYISNIMTSAGYKCGCYTSPHLILPTERIRIDNEYISEVELRILLKEVKEAGLAVNGTQFAAYTAAAILWFSRMNVDIAVMETGLGGRLDPTNYIEPSLTIITPIDYDHMDILGNSLEMIAAEKCGIVKPAVSVISAKQHYRVKKVIISCCKKKSSPLIFVKNVKIVTSTLDGQVFYYDGEKFFINSIGIRQPDNAALAILAADEMGIDTGSIKKGLSGTRLKCRTQYLKNDLDMVIDGGHNPAAIMNLLCTLDKHFYGRKKVLLFACMKDKDYNAMIKKLRGAFSDVIVTRVDKERGEMAGTLGKLFTGFTRCEIMEDPSAAFDKAKETAKKSDSLLVVCGSLYLAGLVSKIVNNKNR